MDSRFRGNDVPKRPLGRHKYNCCLPQRLRNCARAQKRDNSGQAQMRLVTMTASSSPAAALAIAPGAHAEAGFDWISIAELVGLGAIWGASFLFQRIAAPELGP